MGILDQEYKCPPNLSGPDCDIPFEQCPDGKRSCYNNSKCVKNKDRDAVTGEYGYSCDCSYASEISQYAGHECEHSATALCPAAHGSTFCTNGGVCGTYLLGRKIHQGCHCPIDFAGAHCQYLKALIDIRYMEGEALMPEVGANFYGFTATSKSGNSQHTGIYFGIAGCVILGLFYTYKKGIAFNRPSRGFKILSPFKADSHMDLNETDLELQTKKQIV